MSDQPKRSQKEIALTYGGRADKFYTDGKLDYFARGHWFRRFRLFLFLIALFGSVALVLGYSLFVGPDARKKWNEKLRARVATANQTGERVKMPWDPEELFNTGPISENHSRLEGGCAACHWGANPDVTHLVGLGQALDRQAPASGDRSTFAKLAAGWQSGRETGLLAVYRQLTKLEQMDAACITCHVNFQQLPVNLHLPQTPQLQLADASFPFAIVDAGACSSCHKEHVGAHRMADVSSETCAQCHGKSGETAATARHSRILDLLRDPHKGKVVFPAGKEMAVGADTVTTKDGVARFLVWREPGRTTGFDAAWTKPFRFYGPDDPRRDGYEGHPPFRYELPTARDPGRLRYGHMQHEQPRVTNLFDKKFEQEQAAIAGLPIREWLNADGSQNCLFCHEPGADGEYRQLIKYDRHCANCHRMDIVVPWIRNTQTGAEYRFESRINIPHRDPEKVRAFLDLQSIMVELDRSALGAGMQDPKSRRDYVDAAIGHLVQRDLRNQLEVLKRVFYTGDPPYESWRQSPTTNRAINACVLCHKEMLQPAEVKDYNDVSRAPAMLPIKMAHRWANHGPFTHEPHKHMRCVDCHANTEQVKDPRTGQPMVETVGGQQRPVTYSVSSAHTSRVSADINMPRQRLCAECHRPMPHEASAELAAAGFERDAGKVKSLQDPSVRTKWQRATGGIKYECLDCHKFHSPSEAIPFFDHLLPKPAAAGGQAAAK